MPIYEYKCQKCGTFEVTQRITENALAKCPTCKGKVKKLISNTSFQLKGTGWYITDYARKGQNGDSKSENGSKAAESKTESKSESKKNDSKKSESKKSEVSSSSGEKASSSTSNSTAT
ncbi:MAG: zinc ribbon domain-containing protein [Deltaproteobacteria bacterium]|nr:zinc ribbon domain-containing protein [Deltaproteobacteria bacterium]